MFRIPVVLLAALPAATAAIIPRPVSESKTAGTLVLPKHLPVALPDETGRLNARILAEAGFFPTRPVDPAKSAILFVKSPPAPESSPEAYQLDITPQRIVIKAATPAGQFYGLQSFAQLAAATKAKPDGTKEIPCVSITDSPRFAWRGFMLDEARHFTGEEGVKRILDAMARYKLNRFHWHLTDSPGWRIEIKKYPKLTEIGSRGSETDRRPGAPREFYTQEQIKGIVAYAKARAITVIPEIDMPGHADAAVRAYPEHDGGGYQKPDDPNKWPHFTFHPAKPETLAFLDDVLTEVGALFPDAGVIHFGGDEVHFGWGKWPELPDVRALMAAENLNDLAGVETWFVRRMAAKIRGLGFKAGGWDEIANRGLPPGETIVWWWRHDKPDVLRQALASGYPVVLTPRRPCYLDFVQHESHQQGRRWDGFNSLEDCHRFPIDLKLSTSEERNVLGIQGSLWTEAAASQQRRDFLTWPRLIALAEAAWTPENRKDFTSFQERLKPELIWLKNHGITPFDPFTNSPEITDKLTTGDDPDKPGPSR
ncbi:MAG: beta-N-acetylhexosaminidase [Verrucomicrobiota bacterium]